jgi:1-acyl-sn-glycerol-3-phosphate acyltransferase
MVVPVSEEIMARVHRLDLPFNRHGIDPYGIRKQSLGEQFTVLGWLYRRYFDVHVFGIENVPSRGRAMTVSNHSGGWALDAMMTLTALFLDKEPPRLGQGMAERFMNRVPLLGLYAQRTGNITGLPENAVHLLEHERLLMVYPEGARGTEKLYTERHSLVDFGTGFLRLALRTDTPIIPVGFVGGGDAIPTILNLYGLAKRFGVPYIPVTPWGLALPRRTTLQIYFGEPMRFEGQGNEEDVVIHGWVEEVKARIRSLVDRGIRERRHLEKLRKPLRRLGAGR